MSGNGQGKIILIGQEMLFSVRENCSFDITDLMALEEEFQVSLSQGFLTVTFKVEVKT